MRLSDTNLTLQAIRVGYAGERRRAELSALGAQHDMHVMLRC